MAKILVLLPDDFDPSNELSRSEFCFQLFYEFRSELEDRLDVSDAYIVEYNDSDADNYLIGKFEPEKLLHEVKSWNQSVLTLFATAISPLHERVMALGMSISEALARNDELGVIQLDSQETYELRKCVNAIDNHFTTFAAHMNYLPNSNGYPYARVLLKPDELKQIETDPAKYAILSVYIK